MKTINILLKSHNCDCNDGYCWDLHHKLFVNGVEVSGISNNGRDDALYAVLKHLGYEVTIELEYPKEERIKLC